MPAGKPWLTRSPILRTAPTDVDVWHVYNQRYGPLTANPASEARFALLRTHAMFYAADTLAGALWETVLRYVEPDANREVMLRPGLLTNMRAVPIRLLQHGVPLLELGQPGLRALFPADSDEAAAVAALLHDPVHARTHAEARQLHADLASFGISPMPMLSWPSRQLSTSNVYLAYAPPMLQSWWKVTGEAIALDDPDLGHAILQQELARHRYSWTPLATSATPPGPP